MLAEEVDNAGIDDEEDEEEVRGVGGGLLRSTLRNLMR